MTKVKSSSLPTVGLECRDDGTHSWKRTGAGREEDPDMRARGARYFRTWECRNDCGAERIKRMDAMGCFITELTRIKYTEPGYLVKGGVDKTEMGLFRLRDIDPDALVLKSKAAQSETPPKKSTAKKAPAKKTPAKKAAPKKVAEPLKRASQRKPAARTVRKPVEPVGGRKTAAKQPTTRRTKQSA